MSLQMELSNLAIESKPSSKAILQDFLLSKYMIQENLARFKGELLNILYRWPRWPNQLCLSRTLREEALNSCKFTSNQANQKE